MKKYILYILGLLFFVSCQEEKLETFSGDRYISFSKSVETDSISLSFFFYPGQEKVYVPLELSLAGLPLNKDLEYKIEVNEEHTTADSKFFKLPDNLIFEKGKIKDTINIELVNFPELKEKEVKLVLNVVENENFTPGAISYRYAKIIFTDMVSQPVWWDWIVTRYTLGEYSEKKFRLFMEVTGIGDLFGLHASEIRSYAIQFKYYLLKEKEEGRTVYEDDGAEMEVYVIG